MSTEPGTTLRVAVVGAGFGGLTMGAAMRAAGIDDFVILDEGDEVDGTWTLTTTRGQVLRAEAVVWAVGQLHHPAFPDRRRSSPRSEVTNPA